ncbi:hypothetical protein AcV5_009397 [Taiwanofungus camphoratus]|nr:hypothetical protein AcV5_009397 [Antrodia cinnamomea]
MHMRCVFWRVPRARRQGCANDIDRAHALPVVPALVRASPLSPSSRPSAYLSSIAEKRWLSTALLPVFDANCNDSDRGTTLNKDLYCVKYGQAVKNAPNGIQKLQHEIEVLKVFQDDVQGLDMVPKHLRS